MTQDEIIEMARQAGFYIIPNSPDFFPKLVAFANLVAAKEREALAQTQEPVPPPWWTAVENILNEYGLQAIDFVADFKQALAQEQEPDYWLGYGLQAHTEKPFEGATPVYTTPPQRTWEPIETAPKDGTNVLVMYVHIDTQIVHNGFWIGANDTDDEADIGWWSYEYSELSRIKLDDWMTPTHWLSLPKLKENNT